MVPLLCIQTNPEKTPSTVKVVEKLEGSVESLQIPLDYYHGQSSASASGHFTASRLYSSASFQSSDSLRKRGYGPPKPMLGLGLTWNSQTEGLKLRSCKVYAYGMISIVGPILAFIHPFIKL
ncbi:hypothetical protein RJ641_020799 [Dillenia turbinata]|uniref:Uncharacterized protein n=1 Tax=Dillenia turbinata TaxID=194707 RepID=A0AAN8US25_9MAGN